MSNKLFAKLGRQEENIFWIVHQWTRPLQSCFDRHKSHSLDPIEPHKNSQICLQIFALRQTPFRCKFGEKIWSLLSRCHLAGPQNLSPLLRSQFLPEVAWSLSKWFQAGKKWKVGHYCGILFSHFELQPFITKNHRNRSKTSMQQRMLQQLYAIYLDTG